MRRAGVYADVCPRSFATTTREPVAGESLRDRPRARYYTAAAGAGAQVQSLMSISNRERILRVYVDDCSTESRSGLLLAKFRLEFVPFGYQSPRIHVRSST